MEGGNGVDELIGSTGNDDLNGGKGDDTMDGGPGTDTLEGDKGDDLCINGENNSNCVENTSTNQPPVANAGQDQSSFVNDTVQLDGTASSDPDGDALTFIWDFLTKPTGSNATLSDSSSSQPTFTIDKFGDYVLELMVNDGSEDSDPDTVTISTLNSKPTANAGTDQSGFVGDTVQLDGTGSSDVDGDTLSFFWDILSKPQGSNAVLNDPNSIQPSFTIDKFGDYIVELIVNDGTVDSDPDITSVSTLNSAPIADAGIDQSISVPSLVTLDGSGSSDVDGNQITYNWSIVSIPENSNAVLSDTVIINPTFTADLAGTYVIQLIVNDGFVDSDSDTVVISSVNTVPIADAGLDQTAFVTDTVVLDGSSSTDADGDNLTYSWSFVSVPAGSTAVLTNPDTVSPSFVIDLPGDYVAQLIVNDATIDSSPDTVVISTLNSKPVADAGPDQTETFGTTINLDGSGSFDVDLDNLTFSWSLISIPALSSTTLSTDDISSPSLLLDVGGTYVAQLIVNDGEFDSDPDTVVITSEDNDPPVLTIINPVNGLITTIPELTISGDVDEPSIVTINGDNITLDEFNQFTSDFTLTEGLNSFEIIATDSVNNTTTVNLSVTLDTTDPVLVGEDISINQTGTEGVVEVSGSAGSSEGGSTVTATNVTTGETVNVTSNSDGSFSIQINAQDGEIINISSVDGANNSSNVVSFIVDTGSGVQIPILVPEPISQTEYPPFLEKYDFLFTGSNAVQTGISSGVIDPERASVIRGKVVKQEDVPFAGVKVTIKDHPEYGQTITREDGFFDMMVNGGGQLILRFERAGHLPSERRVETPWEDFALLDDVALVRLDTNVTNVDLTNMQGIEVARGSINIDEDGTRQATLIIPNGITANLVMPDGSTTPISTFNIRATEYTFDRIGLNAMPGDLPFTSGYTYAVEYSVDEAITAGAEMVEFNQPIPTYVENFLDFPVGENIPVGYYDRVQSKWIGSDDGRIIKLVSITNGSADVDVNGDNIPDPGTALGITAEEKVKLAELYPVGTELWRVPVDHFTPFDFNWPYGPPEDAEFPPDEEPDVTNNDDPNSDDQNECPGCTIRPQSQTLLEDIAITGTPYNLVYSSQRVTTETEVITRPGSRLTVKLSDGDVPDSLGFIEVTIKLAGIARLFTFPPEPDQEHVFDWNGSDAYNLPVGRGVANVKVCYVYGMVYYDSANNFTNAWSLLSSSGGQNGSFAISTGGASARTAPRVIRLCRDWDENVQSAFFATATTEADALGVWTIDVHHTYDPVTRTFNGGDGSVRDANSLSFNVVDSIAGNRDTGAIGAEDGTLAIDARLSRPTDIEVGPDGSIYFSEPIDIQKIFKIDRDGIITTIAGTGDRGFSGDGGPANQARINDPRALAFHPDESLYFVDRSNRRIRKIDQNGIISTVLGNSAAPDVNGRGCPESGMKASEVPLITRTNPIEIAIDNKGILYFNCGNDLFKLTQDNTVVKIAGKITSQNTGDGGLAINAGLEAPTYLDVGPNGTIYIATNARTIRKISPDGIITTFVDGANSNQNNLLVDGVFRTDLDLRRNPSDGFKVLDDGTLLVSLNLFKPNTSNGSQSKVVRIGHNGVARRIIGTNLDGFSGDGGLAAAAKITRVEGVNSDKDGNIYIADIGNRRIRKISSSLPDSNATDVIIVNEEGTEYYQFNYKGRHLRTLDATTGVTIYSFGYNTEGQLISITDVDGDVVTVQRDGNGKATSITSADNQITQFGLDSNGQLISVTNPANETYSMQYTAGRMTTYTNPRNKSNTFDYDGNGFLISDVDPVGGGWTLNRVDTVGSREWRVDMTSGEGRISKFRTNPTIIGNRVQENTLPDGAKTKTFFLKNGIDRTSTFDGTFMETTIRPDPRFGMFSPVVDLRVKTPSNIQAVVDSERTATLSDEADPFSHTSLLETISFNGKTSTLEFTSSNDTWTLTTPENRVATAKINSASRPTELNFTGFDPINYGYDSRGRLSTISQGVRSNTYSYHESGVEKGYLASITDSLNRQFSFNYDAAGRAIKETLPDSRFITYEYDENGNLSKLITPSNNEHIFNYTDVDLEGQYTPPTVSGVTNPATVFTYNLDKQLTNILRPDGQNVTFNYGQSNGKLQSVAIPRGTYSYLYEDSKTCPTNIGSVCVAGTPTGQVTTINAPGGESIHFDYDGFLLTASIHSGTVSGNVTRTYNNDFNITSRSVNGSNTINFTYDNDLLLTSAGALSITRNAQTGFIDATSLGQVSTSRTYNNFGELQTFNTNFYNSSYTYDDIGRITQKNETIEGENFVVDYGYDLSGRLETVTTNGIVTEDYDYDNNGNRTSATVNGTNSTGSYDEQDRLNSYGDFTYTYNDNGELLTKTDNNTLETTTYNYDVLGSLISAVIPDPDQGSKTIEYVIDGLDRRVGKKVNGTLEKGFLYKDQLNPIAELDGSGNVVSRFVYGTKFNVPDYMIQNGVNYRIISDHLGSVRLVINSNDGVVEQRIDYDSFGNVTNDTNPGFQPFGFAGGLYDEDTKLVRFGARDYDSVAGRWTSKDPIGFRGGNTNLFGYVINDPVNFIDPTGKIFFAPFVVGAIIGGITGGIFGALGGDIDCSGSSLDEFFNGFLIGAVGGGAITFVGPSVGILLGITLGVAEAGINGGTFGDLVGSAVFGGIAGGLGPLGGGLLANFAVGTFAGISGQAIGNSVNDITNGADLSDNIFDVF